MPECDHAPFRADPGLDTMERETTITWAADEDRARLTTEKPGIAHRLYHHPAFEQAWARRSAEGHVVALSGTLPVRYLSISSAGRGSDNPAPVVSDKVLEVPRDDAD